MVLIIDGEIVQDNDPRAVARRKPAAPTPTAPPGTLRRCAARRLVSLPAAAAAAAARTRARSTRWPTRSASRGPIVEIPAVASIPGRAVPTIHLILLGAATLFFGWRVLAVAAVLHVISGLSGGAGAGAAPRPR